MNARIVTAVICVVVVFWVYSLYSTQEPFSLDKQMYAEAVTEKFPPLPPPSVGALNTVDPVQPPMPRKTVNLPHVQDNFSESPRDPSDTMYESAEIPERMRHPERSFSPGYVNDETEIASASGVAGNAMLVTRDANQIFGPEHVQNGAEFMSGIMANDVATMTNYSIV